MQIIQIYFHQQTSSFLLSTFLIHNSVASLTSLRFSSTSFMINLHSSPGHPCNSWEKPKKRNEIKINIEMFMLSPINCCWLRRKQDEGSYESAKKLFRRRIGCDAMQVDDLDGKTRKSRKCQLDTRLELHSCKSREFIALQNSHLATLLSVNQIVKRIILVPCKVSIFGRLLWRWKHLDKLHCEVNTIWRLKFPLCQNWVHS